MSISNLCSNKMGKRKTFNDNIDLSIEDYRTIETIELFLPCIPVNKRSFKLF